MGLPRLVYDSMEQCDEYIIDTMYANIVLAGGTSMLPGKSVCRRWVHVLLMARVFPRLWQPCAAGSAGACRLPPHFGRSSGVAFGNQCPRDSTNTFSLLSSQDSQRKYAAWTGGSMYASLPTYSMIEVQCSSFCCVALWTVLISRARADISQRVCGKREHCAQEVLLTASVVCRCKCVVYTRTPPRKTSATRSSAKVVPAVRHKSRPTTATRDGIGADGSFRHCVIVTWRQTYETQFSWSLRSSWA